jgi:hypothetical protein
MIFGVGASVFVAREGGVIHMGYDINYLTRYRPAVRGVVFRTRLACRFGVSAEGRFE